MDQERQIKSVEEVQEAETSAQLVVDNAKKLKEKMLLDAEDKARRIEDQSKEDANSLGEEILKKADHELAQLRKKRLDEVHRTAEKIRKKKLGKPTLEKLADQAIKEILGA
ncbi:MAG: hypothetical protein ABR981_03460 [Candidatus Micrarchaeaceae archaeon]|jgi:vacuolar-type H+-ATPase subunit H